MIRVLDPIQAGDTPAVQWSSPTGGWVGFALSDVNLDGDEEIVAAGDLGGAGKLTIFDPVSSSSDAGSGGFINGIPWGILYDQTLIGIPRLVATGELDLAAPGDEIVINFTLPPNAVIQPGDTFRFEGLVQTGTARDGRSWNVRRLLDTGNAWTWIGVGNINGAGVDEIALIDDQRGNLSVFALVNDAEVRIFRHSDSENSWKHGTIGQYLAGGDEELAVVRETSYPLAAFFVVGYAGGTWSDVYSEYNDPPPTFVFFADLTGNGDQEAVLLREVPAELGSRPRLFVRDNGNDTFALREELLDADNGYRGGAGGDIDGDGRDEVVIMRGNRLRIFTEPERSSSVQDFDVSTDTQTVTIGNLDANGPSGSSRMGVTPGSVEDTVTAGAQSRVYGLVLRDVINNQSIAYTARIENSPTWASLAPTSGTTPDTLYVTFRPQSLSPGIVTGRLLIETNDPRVADPSVTVPLTLTVRSGASTNPASLSEVFYPCTGDVGPRSTTLTIAGTVGITYTLVFSPTVPWATVTPITGTVPGTATVTLDPQATTATATSTLLVVAAPAAGGQSTGTPVQMLCADERAHLPTIQNR